MKTYAPRPRDVERRWYVIDANDAVLGRLASEVAAILKGKHKPIYAPHADTGDHVIVINAAGVRLTGGKERKKTAYRHSGFPGGLTETGYDRLLAKRPTFVVEKAVKGMLPKNPLGRSMLRKLQVYAGGAHPHAAQKPESLGLGQVPSWTGLPERAEPPAGKTPARKPASAKRAGAAGRGSSSRTRQGARKASATRSSKSSTAKSSAKSSSKSSSAKSSSKASSKASAPKSSSSKASTTSRGGTSKSTSKASSAKSRLRRPRKKEGE
jgi:large subunit ribosomal protein L13